MSNDFVNLMPNNAPLRVSLDRASLIAGLGRHRLRIVSTVSAADDRSGQVTISFVGDAYTSVGGGMKLLGTILPTPPQLIGRNGTFTINLEVEVSNEQVRLLEELRSRPSGGVDIKLHVRAEGWFEDGSRTTGAGQFEAYVMTRDEWLQGLVQIGMKDVHIVELTRPTGSTKAELAKAFAYFVEAETRLTDGDYRGTVESLRQCLAAIVNEPVEREATVDEVKGELVELRAGIKTGIVGYEQRMQCVRTALKFTSDMAAHPEVGTTMKVEAVSMLHMTAGLLYWLGR